jgi:hypothetical protein
LISREKISKSWLNFIFLAVEILLQILVALSYSALKEIYTVIYYSKPEVLTLHTVDCLKSGHPS